MSDHDEPSQASDDEPSEPHTACHNNPHDVRVDTWQEDATDLLILSIFDLFSRPIPRQT